MIFIDYHYNTQLTKQCPLPLLVFSPARKYHGFIIDHMHTSEQHPQFFTASILKWKPILREKEYKEIILDSLAFLVENRRIQLYAYVIMDNHIHIIWQMINGHQRANVQRDFLKFTAHQMRFKLMKEKPGLLKAFEVNLKDRKYQFWQRNPLSVDLENPVIFQQKLDYIHENPVKAGFSDLPETYEYSSASFYLLQDECYRFLTHHEGW